MRKAFEIVYEDGSIVAGTTKAAFKAAPADGIQFVIVRETDGSLTVNKAAHVYEFNGAKKKGSWTDPETYERLKRSLLERSKLLTVREPTDIRVRRAKRRSA